MDNLCHTLAGAGLGEAGLKQRTALGMSTLIIASNLPDIDVGVFATNTLAMSFRRGWTHGVLALVVLPAALAGAMAIWDRFSSRRRVPPSPEGLDIRWLVGLAYLGTWLHVFMDFLNSYGVRLLMPFSGRWFYGDALYIVDPWLYLALGAGVILARRRRSQGASEANIRQPARLGLAVAGVYMAVMLVSNTWARSAVSQGLTRAGRPPETRFMVTPVIANPFRREVIIDVGERYEKGFLWFTPLPHFRPAGYGVDVNRTAPAAEIAAKTPRFAAYLHWSRFPFFVVEPIANGARVYLNDYRYSGPSGREGWSAASVDVR
jgi:inner membrane protein